MLSIVLELIFVQFDEALLGAQPTLVGVGQV